MPNLPATIDRADARLPQTYENARLALAECERVDECKDWADKAAALASYHKQADNEEMFQMLRRIQARAVRRAGELLKDFQADTHENLMRGKSRVVPNHNPGTATTQRQAAKEAGMTEHQTSVARQVAEVPEDVFEEAVESESPPSVSALAEMGKKKRPKPSGPKPFAPGERRLAESFVRKAHILIGACEGATMIKIPHLDPERLEEYQELVGELRGAARNIDGLRKSLEERCQKLGS